MPVEPVGGMQGSGGGIEGWQDVGGLADVRAALQQALELPNKYASLIARSPLLKPLCASCSSTHAGHDSHIVYGSTSSCSALCCHGVMRYYYAFGIVKLILHQITSSVISYEVKPTMIDLRPNVYGSLSWL